MRADVLQNTNKHQWSYSLLGVGFFTPTYGTCYGMSAQNWPSANPRWTNSDSRPYLSGWACNDTAALGGCCSQSRTVTTAVWGQAFHMHVQYFLPCSAGFYYLPSSGACIGEQHVVVIFVLLAGARRGLSAVCWRVCACHRRVCACHRGFCICR